MFFAFITAIQMNNIKVEAADTTNPELYFSDFQADEIYYDDDYTKIVIDGGGFVVTFEDETGLKNYNNTAYYRYQWCYENDPSRYQGCEDPVAGYEDWISVTADGGTRTSTRIDGIIYWPWDDVGEANDIYLWIEGYGATDTAGNRFYTDCVDMYCDEYIGEQYYPYIFHIICDYSNPEISVENFQGEYNF